MVELLTSGTLNLLKEAVVDIFAVGGGGGGAAGINSGGYLVAGGAGGGGYTTTALGMKLAARDYEITIGAGGANQSSSTNNGYDGENSMFDSLVIANGGKGGASRINGSTGGAGGSGGAAGYNKESTGVPASGGSNGSSGGSTSNKAGGSGQGTTTREFGEALGKLYSGGGGGGNKNSGAGSGGAGGLGGGGNGGYGSGGIVTNGSPGKDNTGGGGGAGGGNPSSGSGYGIGGAGGSGIVCIRLHKEKKLDFTYSGDYTEREDGVVELKSSGTITFPKEQRIDVFMVGGGGKGGSPVGSYLWRTKYGYGGGGGGYTKTINRQSVQGSYEVVIGNGSTANSTYKTQQRGGATSFGNLGQVEGGVSGYGDNSAESGTGAWAGNGGSGGGAGVQSNSGFGAGGSDGENGENGFPQNGGPAGWSGGTGQGTTTREFNEPNGKLYAGGGGGGRYMESNSPIISLGGSGGGGAGGFVNANNTVSQAAGAGEANTGGGGGGGYAYSVDVGRSQGGNGGSGIVCFRKAAPLPELAGTWVLNERLYYPDNGLDESFNFTAMSDGGSSKECNRWHFRVYETIPEMRFYYTSGGSNEIYKFNTNTWATSNKYKTIIIPSGATASDEFRAWLADNATKQ